MQGFARMIPTETKVAYLNQLLRVGFDTLDFGSFVSPKAVPQMADTEAVLRQLDLSATRTRLLAIVANRRGAEQAAGFDEISDVGFPLSVSETFQQRNTNKSIAEALAEVADIQNLLAAKGKTLVVYLSMAFGNPYDDPYDTELVSRLAEQVIELGVSTLAPSDTVGAATPEGIGTLFRQLLHDFPNATFGAHLHATPQTAAEKIVAAVDAGCRRLDGALRGFGGCPMAKDDLVGNVPTENIVAFLESQWLATGLNHTAFTEAWQMAGQVFGGPLPASPEGGGVLK
ncbi:MAG: hydroxymethylglutaryl-CoA lyase [Cytophagales bacterium]|nr:hydroxymethylglutaryl-CoA lyase [Cytophagales bacterium]